MHTSPLLQVYDHYKCIKNKIEQPTLTTNEDIYEWTKCGNYFSIIQYEIIGSSKRVEAVEKTYWKIFLNPHY